MRKAELLEMTAQPAEANFGSSSRAMSASSAAKMMRGTSVPEVSGVFCCTINSATCRGRGVSSFQRQASPYGLPALRSLAASQVISNQG